jgi:hypothetical protein
LSYDRVYRLIGQLPDISRTKKKALDIDGVWNTEHLLAFLIDAINVNTWVAANHGVPPSKQSKPLDRFYRPGDSPKKDVKKFDKVAYARLLLLQEQERLRNG